MRRKRRSFAEKKTHFRQQTTHNFFLIIFAFSQNEFFFLFFFVCKCKEVNSSVILTFMFSTLKWINWFPFNTQKVVNCSSLNEFLGSFTLLYLFIYQNAMKLLKVKEWRRKKDMGRSFPSSSNSTYRFSPLSSHCAISIFLLHQQFSFTFSFFYILVNPSFHFNENDERWTMLK